MSIEAGLTWCLTLLSIVGVVLNIRHRREGFAVWMVTNLSWAIVDLYKGIPAQATLFFIYFILAVWGYIAWGKKPISAPAAEGG